jgi:hypothetical protein
MSRLYEYPIGSFNATADHPTQYMETLYLINQYFSERLTIFNRPFFLFPMCQKLIEIIIRRLLETK